MGFSSKSTKIDDFWEAQILTKTDEFWQILKLQKWNKFSKNSTFLGASNISLKLAKSAKFYKFEKR